MPKHFQLKIADPCHEDWDKMTPSEKGKYCGSCQKQVIDFTGMTDTQLAAFFKKPSSGSMCGRFFDDQLDRKITVPRKEIPWIKYFFQITLPLFLASCAGNKTKGKVAVETVQNEGKLKKNLCTATTGMISFPDIEEVRNERSEVVGELEFAPIPDTIPTRGITVPDENKIRLNNLSDSIEISDSVLTKRAISEEEVPQIQINQELKGFLGGFIVKYDDTDNKIDEETSEPEILEISNPVPSFKLYANPARANSNVYLDAKLAEEGMYAIQLLNFSGQLIKQDQVRVGKGMGAITFSIPSIPSGNYLVVLLNKKTGKAITEKLIVQ